MLESEAGNFGYGYFSACYGGYTPETGTYFTMVSRIFRFAILIIRVQ